MLNLIFSVPVFAEITDKKVCVMDFKNLSQYNGLGLQAADAITSDLKKINTFQVIDRKHLKEVLQEQAFMSSGIVETNKAVEIGKILGVNYIVTGTVDGNITKKPGHYVEKKNGESYWVDDRYSSSVSLNLTMIDVQTGEIIVSSQTDGSDSELIEALSGAVYDAVRNFYSAIPLQGYVIKVEGDHYYIDLGRNKNITLKDRFNVIQEGEAIIHPKTGKKIQSKKNIATIEVVDVFDDMAIAVKTDRNKNGIISTGDSVIRLLRDKPGRFLGIIGSKEHVY